MTRSLLCLFSALLGPFVSGCIERHSSDFHSPPPNHAVIDLPLIEHVAPTVYDEIERLGVTTLKDWSAMHGQIDTLPGQYKRRLVIDALEHPWDGLSRLEHQGRRVAKLAEGGAINLPALLDVLEAGMNRTSTFEQGIPFPLTSRPGDLIAFLTDSIEQASRQRDQALAHLTETDRRFLFAHTRAIAEQFSPQISPVSDAIMNRIHNDVRFAELLERQVDYGRLIAAGQTLARMANERWLQHLASTFVNPVSSAHIPGVTGDVMWVQDTPYGLLVIGGPGPNTYQLDTRFCLVIDLGGDDSYRGLIAASDEEFGNSVVIDMSGNDRYEGNPFGLATGRLGVGLLVDYGGDDVYRMQSGAGGAGFGGLGILYDASGHDAYFGDRLTLGAAIGGLGLLMDEGGNDRYVVPGFGLGFGGPLGAGAVVDLSGDDDYQCGGRYPSAYNAEDAPKGKPGDPLFQYDCFGLGTGSGQRVYSTRPEWQAKGLAGGWGLLLDIGGNDRYDSANFSQGHGYFYGAGMKLDLAGNDDHAGARYGHGASAHYGVGLFIDGSGADQYRSSGPYYNGGVAWDHGASLLIDAGHDPDVYLFDRSTGLGRADYGGWGVFIDEGGADQYRAQSGFGETSEQAVAAFFDLDGKDLYVLPAKTSTPVGPNPKNGIRFSYSLGGIFVDR